MDRTALLIRCTTEEAARIRIESDKQRRTISGYVLQIMGRAVEIDERLSAKVDISRIVNPMSRRALLGSGPRTAILVRCSIPEANRIRESARRRDTPINAFVLQALRRSWASELNPPIKVANLAPEETTPVRQA